MGHVKSTHMDFGFLHTVEALSEDKISDGVKCDRSVPEDDIHWHANVVTELGDQARNVLGNQGLLLSHQFIREGVREVPSVSSISG
jgi:hypothetical protein